MFVKTLNLLTDIRNRIQYLSNFQTKTPSTIVCFVSNKFNITFEYFCNIITNSSYLFLICICGFPLFWKKLGLWRCNRKVYYDSALAQHINYPSALLSSLGLTKMVVFDNGCTTVMYLSEQCQTHSLGTKSSSHIWHSGPSVIIGLKKFWPELFGFYIGSRAGCKQDP